MSRNRDVAFRSGCFRSSMKENIVYRRCMYNKTCNINDYEAQPQHKIPSRNQIFQIWSFVKLFYVKSLTFVYQHIFYKNKSWNSNLTLNDDIWSRLKHVSEIFITSLHVHCFQKPFRETVYTISRSEKTREFVSNEFCNSITRKIATLEVKVVNVGINVGW